MNTITQSVRELDAELMSEDRLRRRVLELDAERDKVTAENERLKHDLEGLRATNRHFCECGYQQAYAEAYGPVVGPGAIRICLASMFILGLIIGALVTHYL